MNFFDNGHGGVLPNGAVLLHLQARMEDKFSALSQNSQQHEAQIELPHAVREFTGFHLATDVADHFLPGHFPDDHLFL